MCEGHLGVVKREKAALPSQDTSTMGGRETLFRHLVNSDLPPSELTDERLSKEAQVLIGSGTITTAGTMGFICYYIMADPAIRKRLGEELKDVMEGYPEKKPTWAQLEKVEYFQAIIKESLRYAFLVSLLKQLTNIVQ
jgi:cytochrome P450